VAIAKQSLSDNLEFAIEYNASQLAQGLQKDGTKSDFTYAPFTIASKRSKSGLASVTDRLTNYDTGESYRQLYAKIEGSKIIFGTKTNKEGSISARMDGKGFGLTPDNKEEFIRQNVRFNFIKKIKDILKL
jgi:hypothetical protein